MEPGPKAVNQGVNQGVGPRQAMEESGGWDRGGFKALILAMATAAEDHSSDDHKDRGGCRSCSSHNPDSGQQVCKEHVGCPEKAGPTMGNAGRQGLKAWIWDPWVQKAASLGIAPDL